MFKRTHPLILAVALSTTAIFTNCTGSEPEVKQPNILLVISDDQSYIHAGIYGYAPVKTPNLDQLAREGILFTKGHTASPMCTVARAALLTGRYPWQNGEAGQHNSLFPGELTTYPEILEQAGYQVGYTGKGWGPGSWQVTGRQRNPAGPVYNDILLDSKPASGIKDWDYAANFHKFLQDKPEGKPFCFWFGASEAHSPYEAGSGLKAGYDLHGWDLTPNFVDTSDLVRSHMLDYFLELEWFDSQLGKFIEILKETGEYENTLIVVTGDNGTPMPGAKANLYDFGTHVPFAIHWHGKVSPGRVEDGLVSQIDLAPLFLEVAGLPPSDAMTGKSLLELLLADENAPSVRHREYLLTAQEKSGHNRHDHLGYPMRSIHDGEYLYIRNFKPDRWPRGDLNTEEMAAKEPTYAKRPAEELYHVPIDIACQKNLADDENYAAIKQRLCNEMEHRLTEQNDPRMLGCGDMYESFPRYGGFNPRLQGFSIRGAYNREYMIEIPEEVFVSQHYHDTLGMLNNQ